MRDDASNKKQKQKPKTNMGPLALCTRGPFLFNQSQQADLFSESHALLLFE